LLNWGSQLQFNTISIVLVHTLVSSELLPAMDPSANKGDLTAKASRVTKRKILFEMKELQKVNI
jgi:hypothetical protein